MFKNKMVAALAAFSLAGGALVGIASPALADEESTTDTQPVAEDVAVEETAPDPAPAEPVEPAPSEPAPSEPAPSEPAPSEPAPSEPAPSEPAPSEPAPSEPVTEDPPAEESVTTESTGEDVVVEESTTLRVADETLVTVLVEPVNKIQYCHATGSESNPFEYLDTSVSAFFNAGHDTHQNFEDIVRPFSYEHKKEIINFPGLNWDAEGQAIFNNGCVQVVVVPGLATASVSFTDASCTAAEQLVLGTVTNATWGPVTDPAGDDDYSVTAFATAGNLFEGALTQVTFQGELDPIMTGEECDNTEVKKVEFCHATGSESHPFEKIETSVSAFFNAGHDTHQNFEDVVPPFSYVKQGEVIDFPGLNWDAEGQAFFLAGCADEVIVIIKVATASVSTTPATCTSPEMLVLGDAVNATWGPVVDPVGDDDYSVTATADADALFAGGLTELTFHGELDPIDTGEDCDNTLQKKVEFCHATGSENNPYVLIETSVNAFFNAGHHEHQNFEDIVPPFSYIKQGEVIDFPGLNWDAAGQAFFAAGCKSVTVLPVVSFTQFTCIADGSYTLGVAGGLNPALVTFTVNGTPGVPVGTYPASVGVTTVTAQVAAPHTLSPAWVDPVSFVFAKPSVSDCVTVALTPPSGLAFTGATIGTAGGLAAAGGLLFLGLVMMYMRRRTSSD